MTSLDPQTPVPIISQLVVLDAAQRLACVAMLGFLGILVTLIFGKDHQIIAGITLIAASLAGLCGVILWGLRSISMPVRAQGRGLVIVSVIIILCTVLLMKSPALQNRLHGVYSSVTATPTEHSPDNPRWTMPH